MDKKFVILIDMDDTIECLTDAWIAWLNQKHGTDTKKEDIDCWDFAKPFPTLTEKEVYAPLYEDAFWDTVRPMPGAKETMEALIGLGHEIYIVTSSVHETISAKMTKVLFRYFPFLDWNHVIVAQKKQMIKGDILIDDGVHNLIGGDYIKILMTAQHNADYDAEANGMIRVGSWEEIYEAILYLSEDSPNVISGKCNVCGKETDKLYVCCSSCGAESFAYCEDCLRAGAEPYSALVSYISCAGNKPEDINEAYRNIIKATLKRLNVSEEKFWADVKVAFYDW